MCKSAHVNGVIDQITPKLFLVHFVYVLSNRSIVGIFTLSNKKNILSKICENIKHSDSIPRNACVACETLLCVTSQESVTTGQTDTRTYRQPRDKVIPMCRYASQATQYKVCKYFGNIIMNEKWSAVARIRSFDAQFRRPTDRLMNHTHPYNQC